MKKRGLVLYLLGASGVATLLSCGTSLYRPISSKETAEALREETLLLLNSGQYENAVATAEKLWSKDKTNESASLYSVALLGSAGVGLFDLTVNSIKNATSGSSQTASSGQSSAAGNNVFNSLSSLLPTFTPEQTEKLKKSIEILDSAPHKKASNLVFQRCLTAGIYTVPTITNLQKSISSVQATLSSLPSKLGSGSGSSCSATASEINSAATEVSTSINGLASLAGDFATAMTIIGECFPTSDGKASLNSVSQQVSKLLENADKGCSIPQTQKIGNYTLPSCLNDTITATGANSAQAGDGTIAGCELFINCPAGSCL